MKTISILFRESIFTFSPIGIYLLIVTFHLNEPLKKLQWFGLLMILFGLFFQIFGLMVNSLQKVSQTERTKSYIWFVGQYSIIILMILISYTNTFWMLYDIDHESFSCDMGDTFFKQFFNCFYYSVITFTTVGYGDIHPTSYSSKFVSILEIFNGFIIVVYVLSNINELKEALKNKPFINGKSK